MNKLLSLFLCCALASCTNYGQLTFLSKLPRVLNENSGLVVLDSTSAWIIEDGSNEDKIYEVDLKGNLLKEFKVRNAKNQDWEDLASDSEGNVYIADTGNNAHKRKEFIIYKLPDPRKATGDKIDAEKIHFRYQAVPGPNGKKTYPSHDSEALFYKDGALYLITKDRGRPFTGLANIYKVPAVKGTYEAQWVGSFIPCRERGICEVTAAAISPEGNTLALLGYGRLWVFTGFISDDFTEGNLRSINLGATTQLESLDFLNPHTLLLSDEKLGATGRNLYSFRLD